MATEIWNKYFFWNDLLARHFFNEDMAYREVLLFANQQLINELGKELGGLESFIQSIKTGPYWITRQRQGICQKAFQAYEHWRRRGLEYPPYISYLVLFVLAAVAEGDFSPIAYYRPLRQLLGEPETNGQYPSFNRMYLLWNDLEEWSKVDKSEELGRFTTRVRGRRIHVGLPWSQAVLSGEERRKLPLIFRDAELDPVDRPSTEVLRQALLEHGLGRLMKRSISLLQGLKGGYEALEEALLNFVLDELSEWDGTVPPDTEGGYNPVPLIYSSLRTCVKLYRASEKFSTTLRISTSHAIPEDGLELLNTDSELTWKCKEYREGWSTELRDDSLNKYVDATSINWSYGVKLVDQENNWSAKSRGSSVKLFLLGKRFGIPDWIESQKIERNCEFLLICESQMAGALIKWGESSCDTFRELKYQGLPEGWHLFEGKNATESFKGVGVLTLSNYLRLSFEGGIKVKGYTYLHFAPPSIILENSSGDETITLNNNELEQEDKGIPSWHLPEGVPLDTPLLIEAIDKDGECLLRRTIKLESPKITSYLSGAPRRNSFGEVIEPGEGEPSTSGALVDNFAPIVEPFPYSFPTFLSNRIIFVGSRPGEIIDWPSEPIEVGWRPVWAIAKINRKKWVVHFCGEKADIILHNTVEAAVTDKRAVKKWAKALWTRRKTIEKPKLQILQGAWAKYLEVAKNVR